MIPLAALQNRNDGPGVQNNNNSAGTQNNHFGDVYNSAERNRMSLIFSIERNHLIHLVQPIKNFGTLSERSELLTTQSSNSNEGKF